MTDLPPWWENNEPHQDIREGKFPEATFAIDLGSVLSGNAPDVYQDPAAFYDKTHITAVLENLVGRTAETIAGEPSDNRVIRLQTGFGGGKTHILLALYHLLDDPDTVLSIPKVKEVIEDTGIDELPESNVAVIVGTDLDVSGGREVEGIHLNTLWGELAYQLGGKRAYDIIQESDEKRTSPGKDKLAEILREAQPCTVLVDELLQYVLRARGVEVGESAYIEQIISFLDELVRAIGTVERAMAVVSLQASERFEMYGDPETAEQLLNQMESKIGRVDTETRPIQKAEIYNIARQRLFDERAPEEDREDIADAYHDYYREHSSDFPDKVQEPEYRDRIVESYPFHPEFIDTLYQQWGSLPDFHRTRGVLRLLAKVVSDQYQEQRSTPLIQPGQLNLANEEIRDEVLRYFEDGWDGVIDSDVAGPEAKSDEIDRQMGGVYHSNRVTHSLAASLFLYSKTGGQNPGATLERLRLGTLLPEMSPTLVADAVSKAERTFFFLHEEDGFYRFTKKPNLNQVQSSYETKVDDEDKIDEIHTAFSDVYGDGPFNVHLWPDGPENVDDDDILRLVILHPDQPLDTGAEETMGAVEEIWENHKDEYRECKNSLVFLAANSSAVPDLREAATTKVALQDIRANQSIMESLTDEQGEELKRRLKNAKKDIPAEIRKAYTEAVVPASDGLKRLTLSRSLVSGDDGIDVLLEEKLKDKDLLLSKLDPHLISADRWGIWPTETDEEDEEQKAPHVSTRQLWNYFTQLPQLPMLTSQKVLKDCVARGVDDEGVFGYGRLTEEGYEAVKFQETLNPGDIDIANDAVVIREAQVRLLLEEEEPAPEPEEEAEEERGPVEPGKPTEREEPTRPRHTVDSVRITANPHWETEWEEVYDAIIDPLARLGADIEVDLEIRAGSEDGLDRTDIERQVEENLTQRGIDYTIDYREEE